jgi:hypothetical protein
MSVPQQCVLCGILLQGRKRRLFCPVDGVKFISERCKPTPFLHNFLENTLPRQAGKLGLCIPCVNWKRRAERGTLRRTARPMLQLDQMILFLMQPGKHQEPDHRCMERLVEAVRQASNPYRCMDCLARTSCLATDWCQSGKFSRSLFSASRWRSAATPSSIA